MHNLHKKVTISLRGMDFHMCVHVYTEHVEMYLLVCFKCIGIPYTYLLASGSEHLM